MPLLYVADVAKLWGTTTELPPRVRIQQAIDHILEMQRYDGGFALWSATGPVEQWLTAYAMDFLTRAKAKGYEVSDVNYQNGLRWLAERVEGLGGSCAIEGNAPHGVRLQVRLPLAPAKEPA